MVPVKVTGGDCHEMLKLELLVGVKLVEAELLLLDGIDTGAVAWRKNQTYQYLSNSDIWSFLAKPQCLVLFNVFYLNYSHS